MSTSSSPNSNPLISSTRPRLLLHALRLHSAGLHFVSQTLETMAQHQQLLACIGWLVLLGLSGTVYCATRWVSRERAVSSSEESYFDITISGPDAECGNQTGTRWAILIAGSSGFGNYRHQADVCHAYHLLRSGGLREENIVVFMYDDIANNPMNPHPGTIINSPNGENVYVGVPKDYTGSDVTTNNFIAALLGNKSAVTGGSRKVIDSGPEDHIFLFYSDHGGPGVLGMPTVPHLYADELVEAFKKKYEAGGYKEMLVYLEACESGSIFEGILPDNLNIYATTASNARESSWGTYCPGMVPPPPPGYMTCLGDLYSVSWMEDSEEHNLSDETLEQQYDSVRMRTSNYNTYTSGSHVMRYGTLRMAKQKVCAYLGTNYAKTDFAKRQVDLLMPSSTPRNIPRKEKRESMMQQDVDLLYLWHKYKSAQEKSHAKLAARDELFETLAHRRHIDRSVQTVARIVKSMYSSEFGTLHGSRSTGQPLVDDWHCLKSMVHAFEVQCGRLKSYGLKHVRVFATMCNMGVQVGDLESASTVACKKVKQRDI